MENCVCELVYTFLVYAFWALSSAAVFVALCEFPGTEKFRNTVLLSAARGKTWTGRDKSLLSISNWSVPQSYFWHFYAIGIFAVLVLIALPMPKDEERDLVLSLLFLVHVLRRFVESVFLLHYPSQAKMHVFAYLFGISYYFVVPFSLSSRTLCKMTSIPCLQHLRENVSLAAMNLGLLSRSSWTLAGLVVFVIGSGIQFHSHLLLSKLRPRVPTKTTKDAYFIPTGGMFGLLSCPHYFGEILIYCGLSLVSNGQSLVLLMNLWVVLNLMLGGKEMHQWYIKRFPNYPKERRAVLPFVF